MPHDIALLRLNSSVSIRGHHVRTACLPDPGDVFDSRDKCFITGWGQTEGNANIPLFAKYHAVLLRWPAIAIRNI